MKTQPFPFHVLAKPVGPACNLGCRYCFYLEKEVLYPQNRRLSDWVMSESVLEEYLRQYTESQPADVVCFAWQGGEPTLLGVDYFRKVVGLQNRFAGGKRVENTIQTNGILLDDSWCEFLARNRFLVGLSLDGPREIHDRHRVDRGGAPSFDAVMQSVRCMKKHGVEFNTLTVVPKQNSYHPLEIYRFLREIGHGFMQFIPIVERVAAGQTQNGLTLISPDSGSPARLSEWSVEPLDYGKFLSAIFDEWVRHDVAKVFVQLFDVTLEAWLGMEPALCVFRKTCGSSAVIEHNGDVYSCDHYVYPANRLGNIMHQPLASMMDSERQTVFGRNKLVTLPPQCLDCPVRFVCNGECPKHRFIPSGEPTKHLNYLCRGYRHFFTHVKPYMDFMAAELQAGRPPANIMTTLRRSRELSSACKSSPGRNDPCPCGSGKKYKRCCG